MNHTHTNVPNQCELYV